MSEMFELQRERLVTLIGEENVLEILDQSGTIDGLVTEIADSLNDLALQYGYTVEMDEDLEIEAIQDIKFVRADYKNNKFILKVDEGELSNNLAISVFIAETEAIAEMIENLNDHLRFCRNNREM